jgi:nitrous oxidase accessory protein
MALEESMAANSSRLTVGRRKRKGWLTRIPILLVGCWIALPGGGPEIRAASSTICPGADLAGLIATSSPGDTLVLEPGVYPGNLHLDRKIVLLGRRGAVIHGTGRGSVITITADSCVLAGLQVEHSGSRLVDEDAGVLVKSDRNLIERNAVADVLFGIYLFRAEENTVARNVISGRPLLALGDRGSGIHIWNARHNRIIGNTITDVRDGLYVQNANHTWIEANRVTGVRYGLHYMYADSNVFLGNNFSSNIAGAAIMYSTGIVMRHNVFAHNRGFSSFGVLFQDCHGLTADSNIIADNVTGMFFEASTHNRFRDNIIAQNDVALEMFQNSNDNLIARNNFIDNLSPLVIVGKRTGTHWESEGRGNYWNTYDGYDLDGDGVGDVPMEIQNVFQYLEGRNPSVRLFLYSPASQALAGAAAAFPIIRINEEHDTRPLMHPIALGDMPALKMIAGGSPAQRTRDEAWLAFPLAGMVLLGITVRRLTRRDPR